ncbi:hypothetical protein [Embleya sp. NPDC001921]
MEAAARDEFPCDAYVRPPTRRYHRAVAVAAPPAVTFRRLCQLTTAAYSYGDRGSDELTPGADHLARGGPFMVFEIAEFERDRHITGVIPASKRRLYGDLAVTYRVEHAAEGSRIVVRIVAAAHGTAARCRAAILSAGDAVMMRRQLERLRSLAERDAARAA